MQYKLVARDMKGGNMFGVSVAISDSYAFVGCMGNDDDDKLNTGT